MRILGIDYGRKKIGLATTEVGLAEPLKVLHTENLPDAIKKVIKVIKTLKIEKIVLGLSEGDMAEETKFFGSEIEAATGIKIDYFDETLTSVEAQNVAIKSGLKRKKRKTLEDAFAATLILQGYLDNRT